MNKLDTRVQIAVIMLVNTLINKYINNYIMDTDNLIKAVLFGITSTIIGIIMYYIFINWDSCLMIALSRISILLKRL